MTKEELMKRDEIFMECAKRCANKDYEEDGEFGLNACIKEIMSNSEPIMFLLEKYLERAVKDVFFNRTMIVACFKLFIDSRMEGR